MTQRPNYVVPTGDFIEEWMEGQGVSAAEFSRRLGVSRKHVSRLLHGEASLSHETALRLESVTGVPARIWNLHETGYREALARRDADEDLVRQYEQAEASPLKYLANLKYLVNEES